MSIPTTVEAAPFSPTDSPAANDDPPGWLIALAVGALLASSAATAATAWHLAEQDQA